MFLPVTEARNRPLIEAAFTLHARGALSPDTYVVDRDAVDRNAAALAAAGAAHGVELWFVVKQLGRNPLLIRTVARHLPRAAAIDVREAGLLHAAGVGLGNVGHLVQIPVRDLPRVLSWRPRVVTVFDRENLRAVSAEAERQGRVQDVLLRIEGDPHATYPGQEGGVPVEEVAAVHAAAGELPGVRVAGVTGFPCVLFTGPEARPTPTATLERVRRAGDVLRSLGVHDPVVDLPSGSSVSSLSDLAAWGATHAEPGHALTGTTPQHAVDPALAEVPAMVYLTEVAHRSAGRPLVFGGGFYPRGHVRSALVRTGQGDLRTAVAAAPADHIDYYRTLTPAPEQAAAILVGDPVVLAFRTQVFVTRSRLAVVSGLSSGEVRLDGLFDSDGRALDPEDPGPGTAGRGEQGR
ncbi:MAG TPA: alanine racemase [Cellulomonas sp.]